MHVLPVLCTTIALALAACAAPPEADPPHAQVTLRVADAALASGAPDVALNVAESLLQKQPGNGAALVAKGDALYALGAMEQAAAAYRKAIAADGNDVGAHIGLGRTLVRSDPAAAELQFNAAAARQPDNVIALNDLGIARDLQGRHAEAQTAYRQALAVTPDMEDVKSNLNLSLSLSGRAPQTSASLEDTKPKPE